MGHGLIADILAWVAAHPNGKVIAYHDHGIRGGSPEFVQTYRNRQVAIWDAAQVLADPALLMLPEPEEEQYYLSTTHFSIIF